MQVSPVVLLCADLERVLEDIEWNVVAVVGVEVVLVCVLGFRSLENNLEITGAGAINLLLTCPPLQRLPSPGAWLEARGNPSMGINRGSHVSCGGRAFRRHGPPR